jgi:uracil-DNA glycosylase family 4
VRDSFKRLEREVVACRRCPRLVAWRESVPGTSPTRERYWAKPVPGFGDERAWLLTLGLAPGAHGANRTGRPFTGDRSGPFFYRALHAEGFASRPLSVARDDGLELFGARITNAVRCAPPANRPLPSEFESCHPYLVRELALAREVRVILCLGALAWRSGLRLLRERGARLPRPLPRFAHGAVLSLDGSPALLASYHPSQQNVSTGKLDSRMLRAVLRRARKIALRDG